MKKFRVTIFSDTYPFTWDVEATNAGRAANEAFKFWKKRFKGSRNKDFKFTVVSI